MEITPDVPIPLTWLQKIAVVAPGVIYSFRLRPDGSACFPYSSPSIERLFGVRPEELTQDASPVWQRVHPDDLQGLQTSIAEAAQAFSPWHCEFRALSVSGSYVWIQGHSVPERESDGNILWYGFLSDVTEKKDTELKLAEEAIRRRILFEQSKDGIVVLDSRGRVFELNQSFADMLGYPVDEARKLAIWDWDGRWTREQLIEMLATAPPETIETRHRRKDGSLVDVEISSSLADWHGQPLRFCICRDITVRKKAVAQVKILQGLLPICAWCKKVRDDSGYWSQIEVYVAEHSQADFSHGICPDCQRRFVDGRVP